MKLKNRFLIYLAILLVALIIIPFAQAENGTATVDESSVSTIGPVGNHTVLANGSVFNGSLNIPAPKRATATPAVAISQTTQTVGAYTVVTFNGVGSTTWTPPASVTSVDYLVVAGGGGGGQYVGGGGGAGGFRTGTNYAVSGSIPVTVGAGGLGPGWYDPFSTGRNGGDSTFGTITSTGGGGGGSYETSPPTPGGSGGGGISYLSDSAKTGAPSLPVTSPVQGYKGGDTGRYDSGGGGGGGAGGLGGNYKGGYYGGDGGPGAVSSITGTAVTYAGGGGGGGYAGSPSGAGGSGGGAPGGDASGNIYNAVNGLGGGGGGSYWLYGASNGGSGVVVVRYLTPTAPVADFTADVTSGNAPLTVQFTDTSTGAPTSWSWSFGDGGTSTVQNPSYQYNNAGTYTVSLTATNAAGSNTETKTDYVSVSGGTVDYYVFADGIANYHNYQGDGDLPGADSTSQGFYQNLAMSSDRCHDFAGTTYCWNERSNPVNDNTGSLYWSQSESANTLGANSAEFAFHAGHGWNDGIQFGTANSNHDVFRSDMSFSRAKWVALDSCNVLNASTQTNWGSVFNGLHMLMSFDTPGKISTDTGPQFVARMKGGLYQGNSYAVTKIRDAWILTLRNTVQDNNILGAYMYAEPCQDDYLPGYGDFEEPTIIEGEYTIVWDNFHCG